MGNMTGWNILTCGLTVRPLVVEIDIGPESLQERSLVQAAEKYGLVYPNIPRPEGSNHPFMGRCAAGCK